MPPRAKTTNEDADKLVQNLTVTGGAPSAAVGTAADDAGTEGQASSVTSEAVGPVSDNDQIWMNKQERDAFIAGVEADFTSRFPRRFPRLTSLLASAKAEGRMPTRIRINCHTEGFRRGGQRHPFGVSDYSFNHFDPAQLEIMLGEPALTVELV